MMLTSPNSDKRPVSTGRASQKLNEACSRIETLARSLGPEARLPSIQELRDSFGVSVGTLHLALSELEARGVVRRRHGSGTFVAPTLKRRLALICTPDFFREPSHSPFWDLLLGKARERAGSESLDLHFASAEPAEQTAESFESYGLQPVLATALQSGAVQGVIGIGLSAPVAWQIEAWGVPFAAFAGPGSRSAAIDSGLLTSLGVRALAERGCRRIALCRVASARNRKWEFPSPYDADAQSFLLALTACGLKPQPELLLQLDPQRFESSSAALSRPQQGLEIMMQLGAQPPDERPEGIVFQDDMVTSGALAALAKLEIRPGKDVQIATHVNKGSTVLLGWENDLVRLQIDPGEIVEQLFQLLELPSLAGPPLESYTVRQVQPTVILPTI